MGKDVRVVRITGKSVFGYRIDDSTNESCECKLLTMPFHEFDSKNLTVVGLWDKLNEKEKLFVEKQTVWSGSATASNDSNTSVVVNKRQKMGSFMMVCSNCNHDEKMSFSALKIRLKMQDEDSDIVLSSIKELQKDYTCSKCTPNKKRGRERNPLFKDIPRKINCSVCSKECAINSGSVYELTGGDKDKIKDYVDNYKCRSCNPDWGSWLKGRKGRKKKVEETV
jgi:hypothetical protein